MSRISCRALGLAVNFETAGSANLNRTTALRGTPRVMDGQLFVDTELNHPNPPKPGARTAKDLSHLSLPGEASFIASALLGKAEVDSSILSRGAISPLDCLPDRSRRASEGARWNGQPERPMQPLKNNGFADRIAAAEDAKRARLAAFKPKPMIKAVEPIDREAERAAEREAVRAARAAAKEAERLAQEERQAADQAAKRSAIKERKALTAAEQKARRDARYAARQARKGR